MSQAMQLNAEAPATALATDARQQIEAHTSVSLGLSLRLDGLNLPLEFHTSLSFANCTWGGVPDETCNHTKSPEGSKHAKAEYGKAAYLLLAVHYAFGIFLLMVAHINVPDPPCAVFGSCHHLGGVWRECQTQDLAFVSLQPQ